MKTRHFIVLLTGIAVLSMLATSFASAQTEDGVTFTVTAVTDVVDNLPGDGACETAPGNGMCTLRAAIMEANALIGADTIVLPEATYDLTIAGADEDESATGDLDITESLTIHGAGKTNTFVFATGLGDRILDIFYSADTVSISDVYFGGGAADRGGGIRNNASLVLAGVNVVGSDADDGGGIYNSQKLDLVDVSFQSNTAVYNGGGLYNLGVLRADDCYFGYNEANEDGGGAYLTSTSSQVLVDSMFSDNSANYGGGIFNSTDMVIGSSFIRDNDAHTRGAGIYNVGELTVEDTWIYRNTAGGGGGIYNSSMGSITLDHVDIYENTTMGSGAGIENSGGIIRGNAVLFDLNVAGAMAGAINNIDGGQADFYRSTFSNNSTYSFGGAIVNNVDSYFVLTDSTITSNNAETDGGGIDNWAYVTLHQVTINGNQAENGGGIANYFSLAFENSTMSGNSAELNGGGIYNEGIVSSHHNTITNNRASSDPISPSGSGGGVFNVEGAQFTFRDTILYANYRQGINLEDNDCYGNLITSHYNLLGTLEDCSLTNDQGLDLIGVDPLLGALADNGGPTQTRALQPGSPAIDAANPDGCISLVNLPLTNDQRGHPLPWDGDADGTMRCDIGAFEAPLALIYLPMTVK